MQSHTAIQSDQSNFSMAQSANKELSDVSVFLAIPKETFLKCRTSEFLTSILKKLFQKNLISMRAMMEVKLESKSGEGSFFLNPIL